MQHIKYREDIDALRGLAVLLVVFYHAFPEVLPGGFVGVDVFFVISGYLITSIMLLSINKGDFSLKNFYARRVRRLFPALVTVLLFVLALGWLVLFPEEYQQLGTHVAKSVIFILNFELINEVGYFDVESYYKPLLHLWTLSVEEQYYLLWPLIIFSFLKINKHPGYLLGFLFIASLLANFYFAQDYTQETYYHTLTRFWQLAAGSLLAIWLINHQGNQSYFGGKLTMLGGGVLIFLSALFIDNQMIYPSYFAIFPVVGAAMVIVANSRLRQYAGLVQLGLLSYPLYLWHWVFISFLYIYLGRKPDTLALMIAVFVSFIFAYFTYKYIEQLRYQKRATPYLITVLSVIGLIGAYVEHEKGLSDRPSTESFIEANSQFKRTPAKDGLCVAHSNRLLDTKHEFDYCRASSMDKSKLIAIIGDSHAHVLFPGISQLASSYDYGTILIANSSCPTLQGYEWGRNPKEVEACKVKIEQVLTLIEKDARIKKVVMATRGPVYIHGEVDGTFTSESVDQSLLLVKDQKQTYDAYFEGFKNTISRLENIPHVKEVFYKLENPELDFLPKEVIPRPYDYFDISTNRNIIDRHLYLRRMSIYRNHVSQFHFSKLTILDPIDALCDKNTCYSNIDGNFLYADDDHFSVFGSHHIASYFQQVMFE